MPHFKRNFKRDQVLLQPDFSVCAPPEGVHHMSTPASYVWWQSRLVPWDEATVHVSELGWSAVGAVFEGIRAYWNDEQEELYVFRLADHCDRLLRSAAAVELPLPFTRDELVDLTIALLRANETREDAYLFPLAYPLEANEK